MNFFFDTLRKLLTLTFGAVFAFVVIYAPYDFGGRDTVPEAEAQWAVIDSANLAVNTAILNGTTGIALKELTLDNIAWVVAKVAISNIMASTIDWINSGFQGSPAFIQDLDRFLLNIGDQVAGAYLEFLGGPASFLCSPFRLNIQLALAIEYQTARERLPYQGCLLSEAFDNFDAFIAGDFLQGGWNDWATIVASPGQYTEFGALLSAQSTFQQRLLAEQQNERQVLSFGNGFLSSEVCEDVPGQTAQRCRIVTPGNVIADRINSVLGTSENSLVSADEINELIGALISQVAVQGIAGAAGILGLSSRVQTNNIGFNAGTFTDRIRNEARTSQGQAIGNASNSMDDVLAVQQDYLALAQRYNTRATQVLQNPNTSPTLRADAQAIVADTNRISTAANRNIVEISAAIAQYNVLEIELGNGNVTQARENEIINEQNQIILSVLQGNYFTANQVASSEAIWENGLNPQNPPIN